MFTAISQSNDTRDLEDRLSLSIPLYGECRFLAVVRGRGTVSSLPQVDWDASRHLCCAMDAYSELHPAMRLVQNFLAFYERWLCVGPFRSVGGRRWRWLSRLPFWWFRLFLLPFLAAAFAGKGRSGVFRGFFFCSHCAFLSVCLGK